MPSGFLGFGFVAALGSLARALGGSTHEHVLNHDGADLPDRSRTQAATLAGLSPRPGAGARGDGVPRD